MLPKSPSDFTFHAAIDRERIKNVVIDGKIPDWTIFAAIYLALAIFAAVVGSPDPSGPGLSP
jgi:hypothetical protein